MSVHRQINWGAEFRACAHVLCRGNILTMFALSAWLWRRRRTTARASMAARSIASATPQARCSPSSTCMRGPTLARLHRIGFALFGAAWGFGPSQQHWTQSAVSSPAHPSSDPQPQVGHDRHLIETHAGGQHWGMASEAPMLGETPADPKAKEARGARTSISPRPRIAQIWTRLGATVIGLSRNSWPRVGRSSWGYATLADLSRLGV